jgi:hypothetical protein
MAIHQAQKNEFPVKRDPNLPPPPQSPYETIAIQRIVELELKFEEHTREINNTLLALATHIESLSAPTPQLVSESPSPTWNPEHSDMLLWDKEENGISWKNKYKGARIFLVCGGPSLTNYDFSALKNRGTMSMCINNSWGLVKPDFWIGFDSPGRFYNYGWMDPSIIKFVPWQNRELNLNHRVGNEIRDLGFNTTQAPNCWYLSNNTKFNPETWFTENSVNWGGEIEEEPKKKYKVSMFAALRLLYYLGFQEVYLLGCDWEMPIEGEAYAWEENRTSKSRRRNNKMYKWMESGLKRLQSGFDKAGFKIYNCNPHSKLELYPHLSYEDAVQRSTIPEVENTRGWYAKDSSNYSREKK